MALSPRDREILQDCLEGQPEGWQAFVDRFVGLIVHVVREAAQRCGVTLQKAHEDDLVAEIFLRLLGNDKAILRRFAGASSLATYLAVVSRRIAIKQLLSQRHRATSPLNDQHHRSEDADEQFLLENRDHIHRALEKLGGIEAQAVRMFHFEGRNYRDLAQHFGLPENSIGPMLSQARAKLRHLLD